MTFIEFFRKQFVDEGANTRNMLSRVPDHQFDYKPHEKSMDMRRLVTHIADLPGWIEFVFNSDGIDFEEPYDQPILTNNTELMAFFEKRYNEGLSTLVPQNEAILGKMWTMRSGDKVYASDPKIEVLRMAFSQQIHHRAQLGVYLRLLNIPIPGSYGPSADESQFE